MSNQILKIVAILMMIGSFVLVVVAYRLSNPPPVNVAAEAVKVPEKTYPTVTAAQDLQRGDLIKPEDVMVSNNPVKLPDSFDSLEAVAGKRLATGIAKGSPLLGSHIAIGNSIAQALRANERAIAIKVSDVIGVGGFIQPGDMVDVIAFFRKDNDQIHANQALVMLRAVRVLSYGEELPPATDNKGASKDKEQTVKSKTGKNNAVIAVNAEETALVTLVENLGSLRLALRPTGAVENDNATLPTTLSAVAPPPLPPAAANQAATPPKPPKPPIEIYHGTRVEQVQQP